MSAERRLKHWGWGFEDQAPSQAELGEAAAGIRELFGFGGEPQAPVPLERGRPADVALEGAVLIPRICSPTGSYERIAHSLGKGYRDLVRGFRGEFPNPPDLVAFPADQSEVERC